MKTLSELADVVGAAAPLLVGEMQLEIGNAECASSPLDRLQALTPDATPGPSMRDVDGRGCVDRDLNQRVEKQPTEASADPSSRVRERDEHRIAARGEHAVGVSWIDEDVKILGGDVEPLCCEGTGPDQVPGCAQVLDRGDDAFERCILWHGLRGCRLACGRMAVRSPVLHDLVESGSGRVNAEPKITVRVGLEAKRDKTGPQVGVIETSMHAIGCAPGFRRLHVADRTGELTTCHQTAAASSSPLRRAFADKASVIA